MNCTELAATGTSIHQAYKAALAGDGVDFFTNELPHQSFLLTFRGAVQQHLDQPPQQQPQSGGSSSSSSAGGANAAHVAGNLESGSDSGSCNSGAPCCTPQELASILASVAGLPIPVVQPLPIGFGTPRWSRPLAAADPRAWEQFLADLTRVYARLLGEQRPPAAALLEQLAGFIISLACCMRWANVNVDDDALQTREFRAKVLQCLQQQEVQEQEVQEQEQEQGQLQDLQGQGQHSTPGQQQQQQPQQQHHEQPAMALSGDLVHRLTYTCLLLLLPPPRPLLAAFFEATRPAQFDLRQLQRIVRGCLFVGAAPPEAWLTELVGLVRANGPKLLQDQQTVLHWLEAFRFFASQNRGVAGLRDATALLEEFSCTSG